MAYTTIDKGSKYFNTITYTGTGSSLANTGVGFQPDWVWIKGRSGATDYALYDAVRGVQKDLLTNSTAAETTQTTGLTAFGSDGFTVGALAKLNTSSATYVAWNWLGANTTVSNTSGSITSTVSANTTAGFSIVTFTYSSGSPTVGHGLGVAPSMVIVKNRTSTANNWLTYHKSMGATKAMYLNSTSAEVTSSVFWNNTAPTSSVFTVSSNLYSADHVAYCFAEIKGYSKFGSYTGNGSTDGTFVYTGFKPAMILLKRTDSAGYDWRLLDNKRNTYNVVSTVLFPNLVDIDLTNSFNYVDFLSNGFKWKTTGTGSNASGGTYIFMAFAENPFVTSTGIPTTAR